MDTEAVEADETCVIVGRKLGPVQESNKGFNVMTESDWGLETYPDLTDAETKSALIGWELLPEKAGSVICPVGYGVFEANNVAPQATLGCGMLAFRQNQSAVVRPFAISLLS
jgi:hypothetical protein